MSETYRSYTEVLGRAISALEYNQRSCKFLNRLGRGPCKCDDCTRDSADAAALRALASQPLTTQLDTARAERDIAVQEREQVTRELEEAKAEITARDEELQQLRNAAWDSDTARRDALREAKAKVEMLNGIHSGGFEHVDKLMVLSILGAEQ